jgi:hypothetical protein
MIFAPCVSKNFQSAGILTLQENRLNFIEASALDRSNVVYAFETIIRDMYRSVLSDQQDLASHLHHQPSSGGGNLAPPPTTTQPCCKYL